MRPFGVSFLYAGWDEESGFQLYHSDPSGNYAGWKAHAIGANHQQAQNLLNTDYKEDMGLTDADWLEGWVRRLEAAEVHPRYIMIRTEAVTEIPLYVRDATRPE